MRRKDREITDFEEILRIMEGCDVCRLGLWDEDVPYVVPLNFGMEVQNGQVFLYFHGAVEGTKYDRMEKHPRVSFEMDRGHQLVLAEEEMECTMAYESVMGRGTISFLPEEEKPRALALLMAHYHAEDFSYNPAPIPRTRVWKLAVEEMTAKRRRKKGQP